VKVDMNPISTTYPRLSKKLYRSLPPIVANAVKQLGEEYRMGQRQITFVKYPEGYVYTAGEGHRVVIVQGERLMHAEMVHSNTVGASGVHYDIGSKTPSTAGRNLACYRVVLSQVSNEVG
jgi:hypothetical protein